MTVADERGHRDLHHLTQLAKRIGQHGGGAAERIPGLRIYYSYIFVIQDFTQLAHEDCVIGELAFAYAPHIAKEPFPAYESVYGNDIIRPVGEDEGSV